jgi:hypothetical protein
MLLLCVCFVTGALVLSKRLLLLLLLLLLLCVCFLTGASVLSKRLLLLLLLLLLRVRCKGAWCAESQRLAQLSRQWVQITVVCRVQVLGMYFLVGSCGHPTRIANCN